MPDFAVDITNCDRELIHIPGRIQAHGFMLVVDADSIIRFYSDNIVDFVDVTSATLIGQSIDLIEQLIKTTEQDGFIRHLLYYGKTNNSFELTNPFQVLIGGKLFYLIISTAAEYYLIEFEPAVSDFDFDGQKKINRSISEMLSEKNVQNLLSKTARLIKNIIRFDRVMIYRFSEKGHGQVVAEERNEGLDSWLGLNYPATDIPRQARELYKVNLTRLINDIEAPTSAISTEQTNIIPLDLTYSQLRAVSPVHIQYLRNMGVATSFSISLLYKNELWGLIACHNYTPKFIDFKSREAAKMLGQILSSALEFRQDEENQYIQQVYKSNLAVINKSLQQNSSITEALTGGPTTVLHMTDATGAVLVYDQKIVRLGITPSEKQLKGLIGWVKDHKEEAIIATSNLTSLYPDALRFANIASGMLVSVLSRELDYFLVWFKPERIQTMTWAGNPEKPTVKDAHGFLTISPRQSFDAWAETVSGTSESWTAEEVSSVMRLKEEITYAVNEKAGAVRAMNEKLRHAYEELDTFSYTISHDLKAPISAIKGYAQLMGSDKTLGQRWHRIAERIEDRADKMNLMINEVLEYSRIGRSAVAGKKIDALLLIDEVIKDLSISFPGAGEIITVDDTPEIYGDPIMVLQIFSNLIGNAVKYSQRSRPAKVHIRGWETDDEVCYSVSDNGLGIAADDIPHIFELFNRMENVKDIEGSGVGLAIVKRIIERHTGNIWVESMLNEGSTFFFTLSKPVN